MYVRNQRVKPLKRYTGSNLADMGRGAVHTHHWWVTPWPCEEGGQEATRKVCGVLVARPQGQSWAPTPTPGHGERGKRFGTVPSTDLPGRRRTGASTTGRAGAWRSRRSVRRAAQRASW